MLLHRYNYQMHSSCPLKAFHAALIGTYTCTLACIRKANPKHGCTHGNKLADLQGARLPHSV